MSLRGADAPESVARVEGDLDLPPVVPRPGRIFCVGLDYRARLAETGGVGVLRNPVRPERTNA